MESRTIHRGFEYHHTDCAEGKIPAEYRKIVQRTLLRRRIIFEKNTKAHVWRHILYSSFIASINSLVIYIAIALAQSKASTYLITQEWKALSLCEGCWDGFKRGERRLLICLLELDSGYSPKLFLFHKPIGYHFYALKYFIIIIFLILFLFHWNLMRCNKAYFCCSACDAISFAFFSKSTF